MKWPSFVFLIHINLSPLHFVNIAVCYQPNWVIYLHHDKSLKIISNYMLEFIAPLFSNENSLLWIHICFSQEAHILTVSRIGSFEILTAKSIFTHDLLFLWSNHFLSVVLGHWTWGQTSLSTTHSRESPLLPSPLFTLPLEGRLMWWARFRSTVSSTNVHWDRIPMRGGHAHALSFLQY